MGFGLAVGTASGLETPLVGEGPGAAKSMNFDFGGTLFANSSGVPGGPEGPRSQQKHGGRVFFETMNQRGKKMGRKIFWAAILFFIMSLAWSEGGWAQSATESLLVAPVTVPTGTSTFFVTISLANSVAIAGVSGRIVFDPNLIQPVVLDAQGDVSFDLINRGLAFMINGLPSGGVSAASPGVVTFLLVPDFAPPLEQIAPGSGSIMRIQFTVVAPRDSSICVLPQDDAVDPTQVKNQLSDTQGLLIVPTLQGATVKLGAGSATGGCGPGGGGGGGGQNNPPVINQIATQSVPQGSILTFTVTASDPDGNNVTLSATSLPQNATFNTVTGSGTVSGTCTFAPSLSQLGNFTATFRAVDDSGASATRSVTINVTEVPRDILFSSSVTGQAPTGAIPGKHPAFFPIDLTVRTKVFGVQFDLALDTGVVTLDSIVPTSRVDNFILDYRPINNRPDSFRVLVFSLTGDSVLPSQTPTILNLALSVSSLARPGKTDIVIDSGWESVNPDPRVPSQQLTTHSGEFFIDRFGDANLDTLINVADVVSTVGFILGNHAFSGRQFDAANTDQDSVVNIVDLVNIINLIFGIPLPPPAAPRYAGPPASLSVDARPFAYNSSEPIKLDGELPTDIAGVQIHLAYDPKEIRLDGLQRTLATKGLTLQYLENAPGRLSVLLYNLGSSRNEIPPGRTTLLEIPATRLSGAGDTTAPKLTITRAFLSTGKGEGVPVAGIGANVPRRFELFQNYPNPFNPKTTIRFNVAASGDNGGAVPVKLEVFNVLGQSVKTLLDDRRAPGNYSVEWDGTDGQGNRVSSGVYLYRLTADKISVTKKMVFLK